MRQLSDEFLECARRRLNEPIASRTETDLRRATSDLYYALFHAVCGSLVEPLRTHEDVPGLKEIYAALYRKPDHGRIEKQSKNVLKNTSIDPRFKRFAQQFSGLKNKREDADYNPLAQMKLSTISRDFETVETVLKEFWEADASARIGFAILLTDRDMR